MYTFSVIVGNIIPKSLVAEFICPKKVYTFSVIVGNIIPKSVKCIHSATKDQLIFGPEGEVFWARVAPKEPDY